MIEEHDFGPIASALDAVSEISFHTPNPSILDRQISTQINHTDKKVQYIMLCIVCAYNLAS